MTRDERVTLAIGLLGAALVVGGWFSGALIAAFGTGATLALRFTRLDAARRTQVRRARYTWARGAWRQT